MNPFSNDPKVLSFIALIEKALIAIVIIIIFYISVKKEIAKSHHINEGLNFISSFPRRLIMIANICKLAIEEMPIEKLNEKANKIPSEIAIDRTDRKNNEMILKKEIDKIFAQAVEGINVITNQMNDKKAGQLLNIIKEEEKTTINLIDNALN